jgi:fructose-bisphosphate aldolase class II
VQRSALPNTRQVVARACQDGWVVPAFNIPYLPMMAPVVQALRDCRSFGLIMVARLEWIKFEAQSIEAVAEEYERQKDEAFTRLHLDHVPVIDEDQLRVDFESDIRRAIDAGYQSVMIDGSRLPFAENVQCTSRVVEVAHAAGVPVEAELGAIAGHEAGPMPPYEELFSSGKGFTDSDEACRFVHQTGTDWLSVAIGSVHGAISAAERDKKKVAARLDIEHLRRIRAAAGIPLVLHGGTGVRKEYILDAVRNGIAKINVATAIRQPYERLLSSSADAALEAVYKATVKTLCDDLEVKGTADILAG